MLPNKKWNLVNASEFCEFEWCSKEMSRLQLSTFRDGSLLPLEAFVSTLVHRDESLKAKYLRVSAINRGARPRCVTFLMNEQDVVYCTVLATSASQLLIPSLALYNSGSGIDVYAAMSQGVSAWSVPGGIEALITLQDGVVRGLDLSGFAASAEAQPFLLVVTDSRRTGMDLDPGKGSEAIVEIFQENGIVMAEVLDGGYNFVHGAMQVSISSGVFLIGDIFEQ